MSAHFGGLVNETDTLKDYKIHIEILILSFTYHILKKNKVLIWEDGLRLYFNSTTFSLEYMLL